MLRGTQCRPERPNLPRLRHKGSQRTQSERLWRLRSLAHGLVRRAFTRAPASPESPVSPAGPSFWHVADVPPVQGQLEVWKLGCLEVWLSVHPFHPSRACRAFRSLWPWKVWRFAPARSVLCSPGRVSAPCPVGGSRPLIGFNLRNRRFPILAVSDVAVGHIGRSG